MLSYICSCFVFTLWRREESDHDCSSDEGCSAPVANIATELPPSLRGLDEHDIAKVKFTALAQLEPQC